ncbi:unnamed protein product [Cylicocyclus nassatus]|uniref:CCHC-type domain-containing protein n=1 Tax=Cylicocyclus nassatus TaxID=53992 RepID=A0AA36DUB3_CYLNA|nr:unnamed protein product [Cylicocyclus nassatus]
MMDIEPTTSGQFETRSRFAPDDDIEVRNQFQLDTTSHPRPTEDRSERHLRRPLEPSEPDPRTEDDYTLIDILGDGHLDDRAKSIFLSLPQEVKSAGFERVVEELRRILANDSMAGDLRISRRRAKTDKYSWKRRLWAYDPKRDHTVTEGRPPQDKIRVEARPKGTSLRGKTDTVTDATFQTGKSPVQKGPYEVVETRQKSSTSADQRKCYSYSRYGHIAKDCPYRRTQVKQVGQVNKTPEQMRDKMSLSEIIDNARSLGLKTREENAREPLVGKKFSACITMLGMRLPAILDTGSMIGIIPEYLVGVLVKAKKAGFELRPGGSCKDTSGIGQR